MRIESRVDQRHRNVVTEMSSTLHGNPDGRDQIFGWTGFSHIPTRTGAQRAGRKQGIVMHGEDDHPGRRFANQHPAQAFEPTEAHHGQVQHHQRGGLLDKNPVGLLAVGGFEKAGNARPL